MTTKSMVVRSLVILGGVVTTLLTVITILYSVQRIIV
jgi:hypothetical protein